MFQYRSQNVAYECFTRGQFQPEAFDWADAFISAGGIIYMYKVVLSHLRLSVLD